MVLRESADTAMRNWRLTKVWVLKELSSTE
jgi:hypothetical protein